MAVQGPEIDGSTAAADALRDWQSVRASADIQFAPLPPPAAPPKVPGWIETLAEWLAALGRGLRAILEPIGHALGVSWPVIEKLLIGLGVLAVAFLLWRIGQALLARRRKSLAAHAAPDWVPDRGEAEALLDDADRLAAGGRYDEATHLLLRRSVGQIAAARPDWLLPASTAREIAGFALLPAAARRAFAVIAERVERSRFALRPLGAEDWQAARDAYAEFALQRFDGAAR